MNNLSKWQIPVTTLDKKTLELIKRKQMRESIKNWVKFDHNKRWTFIIEKLRKGFIRLKIVVKVLI